MFAKQLLNLSVLVRKFLFSNMHDKRVILISKFNFKNNFETNDFEYYDLYYDCQYSSYVYKIYLKDDDANPIAMLSRYCREEKKLQVIDFNNEIIMDILGTIMLDICNMKVNDSDDKVIGMTEELRDKIKLANDYSIYIPSIDDVPIEEMYDVCWGQN